MKCKLSEKCEFGNLCKDATRHDSLTVLGCSSFKTKKPMTEQEWLQTCNTEQLAESLLNIMANNEFTLYLLHTEKKSVQEMKDAVVEWLKQPHTNE